MANLTKAQWIELRDLDWTVHELTFCGMDLSAGRPAREIIFALEGEKPERLIHIKDGDTSIETTVRWDIE